MPELPGTGLPLVGRVAAGNPILAAEHIEAHVRLDPALFAPRADYLLRVRGLSMKNAGILDGDLLAVHRSERRALAARSSSPGCGDYVTVKRLQRDGRAACCSSPRTRTSRRSSSKASATR